MPEGLYEQVLHSLAGRTLPPPKPPRASAAVVPWRRGPDGLEVYWVRRSSALAFMGGWYAFPGGGISKDDSFIEVQGHAVGLAESDDAPGLVAGTLRELSEETGLLPGATDAGDALEEARRQLLAGTLSWRDLLSGLQSKPRADDLVYAGRWLTPAFGPLRFDNRFFLLEWPADRPTQPTIVPGELSFGEWIRPLEALSRWRRGDVMAAPPVLYFLTVLAEDGPETGLQRLRDAADSYVGEFRRIEFRPGTLVFPLQTLTLPPASTTNCILLGFGDAVLIDPGAVDATENARLIAALADVHSRLGRRVTAIWLTHHHPDHIGGVQTIRQALSVPVLAHALTAERVAADGIAVDALLADNQQIELAGETAAETMRIRVLHTPGHASGHLAFLDEARGTLIAGDLVSALGTVVIDPPEGNMDDYLASLARIRALSPHVLLPAHGSALIDPEKTLRETIDHRLQREHRVAAAWSSGLRDPAAMVDAVYDDTPDAARPLAERQIRAHLERLEHQGLLEAS